MGSETVWGSKKGRWLRLRDKLDVALSSAANWKPIPLRPGISVIVSVWRSQQQIFSPSPCLSYDHRETVWSAHLRYNTLGQSGDMLITLPEGFFEILLYMAFYPLEFAMKWLHYSHQNPAASLGRNRAYEHCGKHGGESTVLFISHTPEERKVFRSFLYFTDSQCKHFKAGVDLPELGRSKNRHTQSSLLLLNFLWNGVISEAYEQRIRTAYPRA